MKKTFFSAIVCMALISCNQNSDILSNVTNGTNKQATIFASIEQEDDDATRSTYDKGYIKWADGDEIRVQNSNGIFEGKPFLLDKGAGTTQGTFKGELTENTTLGKYAFYPSQYFWSLEGNNLNINMPPFYGDHETEYTPNTYAYMLGIKNNDGKYIFKHLCGIICVTVRNVPVGINTVGISLSSTSTGCYGGATVTLEDNGEVPVITGCATANNNIEHRFKPTETIQDMTFYFPIPILDSGFTQISVFFRNEPGFVCMKTIYLEEAKKLERAQIAFLPDIVLQESDY